MLAAIRGGVLDFSQFAKAEKVKPENLLADTSPHQSKFAQVNETNLKYPGGNCQPGVSMHWISVIRAERQANGCETALQDQGLIRPQKGQEVLRHQASCPETRPERQAG